MALTYARKLAADVDAGDKISVLPIQSTGVREYSAFHGPDGSVDERPTVDSVSQVRAPGWTDAERKDAEGNPLEPTGPVTLHLSGGRDTNSVQTVVLAPTDAVVVSTGTPAAGD